MENKEEKNVCYFFKVKKCFYILNYLWNMNNIFMMPIDANND